MAAADSGDDSRFAKVSSLYGSGTIAAWYLTILSVLIAWTLHPSKRKSGSIEVDLVAILTLPAVAAGHVISLRKSLLKVYHPDGNDIGYIQLIAATEAPFIVTETFMMLSVILFLVAAWMFCIRRAFVVGLIGLQCFTVECWVHFSEIHYRYRPRTLADNFPGFSRLFVADFRALIVIIIVSLGLMAVIAGLLVMYMLSCSKRESSSSTRNTERMTYPQTNWGPTEVLGSNTAVSQIESQIEGNITVEQSSSTAQARQIERDSRYFDYITLFSLPFVFVAFITSAMPVFWHGIWYHTVTSPSMTLWQTINDFAARFAQDFFPRTDTTIIDLDQAIAAAAGATVLAFRIYSVAKEYFKIWNVSRDSTGIELN